MAHDPLDAADSLKDKPALQTAEAFDFTADASADGDRHRKSSYSLLLLFYVTTVAAILAAVCRLAFVDVDWSTQALVIGYAICGGLSVLMSMILGFLIGRTWISTLMGLLAGAMCGVVVWLMILVNPSHYESAGMLLCAGCWLLSIISIVGNRWQS